MTRKINLTLGLIAGIALFMTSCGNSYIYESYKKLPDKAWLADSVYMFDFEVKESQKIDLSCLIRYSLDYPYHNLYIQYALKDLLGNTLNSALINMNLFDPKTGKPLGKGWGGIYTQNIPFLQGYLFDSEGVYSLKVQQRMRMDTLPEILSVGLGVKPTPTQKARTL